MPAWVYILKNEITSTCNCNRLVLPSGTSEAIEMSYKSVQFFELLPVSFALHTAEPEPNCNIYGYFASIEHADGF